MGKTRPVPQAACPICGARTEAQWRPFCSRRCADVDLGRWMNGSYAVPTEEEPGGLESSDPED